MHGIKKNSFALVVTMRTVNKTLYLPLCCGWRSKLFCGQENKWGTKRLRTWGQQKQARAPRLLWEAQRALFHVDEESVCEARAREMIMGTGASQRAACPAFIPLCSLVKWMFGGASNLLRKMSNREGAMRSCSMRGEVDLELLLSLPVSAVIKIFKEYNFKNVAVVSKSQSLEPLHLNV